MLIFTCSSENKNQIIDYFIQNLYDIVKQTELKTLVFDFYDDNLKEELYKLVEINSEGFEFDMNDGIGEEPYGYVTPFFESFLSLLESVKEKFSEIGISGYFSVLDLGCAESICRQKVYTTKDMSTVEFTDQLQCIMCHKWVDIKDAYKILNEEDLDFDVNTDIGSSDGEWIYPSGYCSNDIEGAYCFCSKDCEDMCNF